MKYYDISVYVKKYKQKKFGDPCKYQHNLCKNSCTFKYIYFGSPVSGIGNITSLKVAKEDQIAHMPYG